MKMVKPAADCGRNPSMSNERPSYPAFAFSDAENMHGEMMMMRKAIMMMMILLVTCTVRKRALDSECGRLNVYGLGLGIAAGSMP
jgi:hypothetical protein